MISSLHCLLCEINMMFSYTFANIKGYIIYRQIYPYSIVSYVRIYDDLYEMNIEA